MTTNKEYEIVGVSGDDVEWCAGTDDLGEAKHYALQYINDYDKIEVYEVIKQKIMEYC